MCDGIEHVNIFRTLKIHSGFTCNFFMVFTYNGIYWTLFFQTCVLYDVCLVISPRWNEYNYLPKLHKHRYGNQ